MKLQIHVCCFNSCLLYMYTNGFFSTRSPNISYLHVLDRIKLKKYIDKFNKKVMSCKIHETSVCFVLFGLILTEVMTS